MKSPKPFNSYNFSIFSVMKSPKPFNSYDFVTFLMKKCQKWLDSYDFRDFSTFRNSHPSDRPPSPRSPWSYKSH